MKNNVVKLVSVAFLFAFVSFMSGCSAVQEGLASQMEVPTLEKQANRVAIGMTIVRENNIMSRKMQISSDAKWPKKVSAPLTESEKLFIKKALLNDPYFATVNYTEPIQRKELGSGVLMNKMGGYGQLAATMLNQTITPLMYRAFHKIIIFYGKDKRNWPNIFNFDATKGNFNEFRNGKLLKVEALRGDVFDNVSDAFISLAPVNLQKDMQKAKEDMMDAYSEVLDLKREKADIETRLKQDDARKSAKKQKIKVDMKIKMNYQPLTEQEKADLKQRLATLDEEIKQKESVADEKEKVYFALIDQAGVALQSDINIDDEEYVKLATNINLVAKEISDSSTEAYTSFGIAAAQIAANNIILNFPKELKTLAMAKAYIPLKLQDKYNIRIKRLIKNTIYIMPNVLMGTYYAHKQSVLADKYKEFTDIILEAYNAKLEQESKKKAPTKEEVEKAEKKMG